MLNKLWLGFFLTATVAGLARWLSAGDETVFAAMVASLFDMARLSVEVMILLFGTLSLWLGFLHIAEQAGLINFNASGQIPTRADLASDPTITEDPLALPFVQAAGETSAWPLNSETAQMQVAIGVAVSEVISGQTSAADAAAAAVEAVNAASEAGGGTC